MMRVSVLVMCCLLAACSSRSRNDAPVVVEGAICGSTDIAGTVLPPIEGNGACGIDAPVRVTQVAGVDLSRPARINCDTAVALRDWVRDVARPELADEGDGLSELRVFASYSCRTRNSVPGARLSEHSFGNAIDIGGFTLRDGTVITLLNDWGSARFGRALRALQDGACGIFGTVLGPEADAAHRDHFHFDVASYRSGAYCR